ncbi:nucleoside hydrolase [Pedobacter duraquae]|uniref:Inosine-uridine preferring nucleoside hydrolase n=1 Tax=Pedobacter duraquae TaxID=425511 RepID=A0A4R6IK45_9SPHI|nr:nucleoside hydrolase [Pedobacter duraquae]TDO22316.1 inosine-uridine preferring nucleoside hydrolase [Pedobacter duraquae]
MIRKITYTTILLFVLGATSGFAQQDTILIKPRIRVMIDNDFSGDPDGLFQLVHHLLSPSVKITGVIGSHLKKNDPFDPSTVTADHAVEKATEVIRLLGMERSVPVYAGSNTGLDNSQVPKVSAAAQAIVREAMRTDTKLPLYIVCGAGLTDVASAYLIEPKIAEKITLVWIGGPEYEGLAFLPPGSKGPEYNLAIDIKAVQTVFNSSKIPVWQVPRNAYRQTLLSYSELSARIKPQGKVGLYLYQSIEKLMGRLAKVNYSIGETYIIGDSPLVLLTALQSSFEADPSSSDYVLRKSPKINDEGFYEANAAGRTIRVYTRLDTRLMFDDLFAKLSLIKNN